MMARWENECIYLTVCPLHGPGSIPGRVFQGMFPWLITLRLPFLSQFTRKKHSKISLNFVIVLLPERLAILIRGVMSQLSIGALLELCSPFLKGGYATFIVAVSSRLFPKTNIGHLNNYARMVQIERTWDLITKT